MTLEWENRENTDFVYKRYNVIIEGPAIKPEDDKDVKKNLPPKEPFRSLAFAVIYGDSDKARDATKEALASTPPIEVIEKGLSKGMDAVSALYAKGAYFLPDVMLAADAMMVGMNMADAKLG